MPKKPLKPLDPNKPLTLKQRKFVAEYLKTGHQTNSALKAGYSENTAPEIASQNLKKLNVATSIAACLEKAGLTDDLIAKKLRQGSYAKETKFFSKDGLVTDQREVIAWDTRKNYIELAAKLKGHLRPDVVAGPMSPGVIVNMRFSLNQGDQGDQDREEPEFEGEQLTNIQQVVGRLGWVEEPIDAEVVEKEREKEPI